MAFRRSAVLASATALVLVAVVGGSMEIDHLIENGRMGLRPVCRVAVTRSIVGLSFDDGPSRLTPAFLRVLGRYGAKATFFVVGERAEADHAAVEAVAAAGMGIGNHSWDHPVMPELSAEEQLHEMARTNGAIEQIDGDLPSLFRAPFGDLSSVGLDAAASLDLRAVGWTVAVEHDLDGLGMTPAETADSLGDSIQPGDIILAHDGGADRTTTLETLPLLLDRLSARGIAAVSVETLLASGRSITAVPRPWFWQRGFTCPVDR